jgi:trehalose/maltose hydrolase-like predicted phosphorylase
MFIAPYFLATDPDVVKSFIRYRIGTLEGAKRKAAEYGHAGAFYAWESQETGDDACSDFNVVDVFTKRPLRTYFRDRQIHISADVVYALREYIDATGDRGLLAEGGLEMAVECARFFMSWAVWSPLRGRYEIHDVIGPDEYHERVANNAFTNRMIAHTFETTLMLIDETERDDPALLAAVFAKTGFRPFVGLLREMREKLYVPAPGEDSVIEQFDGYYKLENCSVADVRSRLLDPKEYWGGGNGVASNTRVIKQADVVLMMSLFGDDYTAAEKKANLDFYEPRTEHGSSLSACVYSLLACETGDSAWGYPFFVKSAEIDMTGQSKHFAGLVYIGGTHPAANGGAWMSAIRGFCGLSLRGGKVSVNPRLPERWTRVSFHARSGGKDYLITVTKDGYTVCER